MTKLFLKTVVLLILVIGTLSFTDRIFKTPKLFEKTLQDYDRVTSLDVAIFGSSHAHSSYDPRVLEANLGLSVFNFGAAAQRFENTELVAKYVVDRTAPKLAVIDIYKNSLMGFEDPVTAGLQYETLDNLPFSLGKYKVLRSISEVNTIPYTFSTTFRNHGDWSLLERQNFSRNLYIYQNSEIYKGLRTANDCFNSKTWDRFEKKYKNKNKTEYDFDLSETEISKINRIKEIFQNNGIPILFVNAPSYVNDYDSSTRRYAKILRNYIEKKEIPFIDFNLLKDSLGLKKHHYKDPNHLNGKGAQIVSEYLSYYIENHFELDSKEISRDLKEHNRYTHINENFENALFTKNITQKDSLYEGITKMALIRTDEDRFEIILETTKATINDLRIKLNYAILPNEEDLLPTAILRIRNGHVAMFDYLTQCNNYDYNNKHYLVFSFQYTLPKIHSLQFFIGQDLKTELFHIKNDKIQ